MPTVQQPPLRNDAVLADLQENVAAVFNEVQLTIANHNKNCVNLFKFHDEAREICKATKRGGTKAIGEHAFQKVFLNCIFQTLRAKKGDVCADRAGRFVGAYLKYLGEKADEDHFNWANEGLVDIESDHYGIRFSESLLKNLIPGCGAKDKNVRYRVLFLLSQITRHLGPLNLRVHENLKEALSERTDDKESGIRGLVAVCVAQVYAKQDQEGGEDEECEDDEEGEHPGRDILLDMLSREPIGEVRKIILNNVRLDSVSIPHVVKRARDTEASVRKVVYGQVLKKGIHQDVDGALRRGPSHPNVLPLEFIESIVKKGLRDREAAPRQAAVALVNEWVKTYECDLPKPEPGTAHHAAIGVISLAERFNIVERKGEDLEVVELLLESIFSSRKDITDGLDFGESSWRTQGPENAIISRVFIQYCDKEKDDDKLDEILPVIRNMKEIIESYYGAVIQLYDLLHEDTKVGDRDVQEREFILGEMLKIGKLLDYSDRYGAQEMLTLMRRMLSEDRLPDHLLPLCLDVLREIANNERDYIRIIVEQIQELLEPLTSPDSMDEDDGRLQARCLKMCIHSLERVTSTYEENSSLRGILDVLISPCLKHEDPDIRRDATTCFGLCAVITKLRAPVALSLCLSNVKNPDTPPDIKVVFYKIMYDLLMRFGKALFTCTNNVTVESLEEDLLNLLNREDDLLTVTVLCEGLMKLVLTDFISRPQVILINLLQVLVSPQAQDHAYLLQRLNYFFDMYSVSSTKHQRMMQEIFVDVLKEVSRERERLPSDEQITTTAKTLCDAFRNWTNPLEMERNLNAEGPKPFDPAAVNHSIQIDLAESILKALFEKTRADKLAKDDKKALYQLLPQLYFPDDVDVMKIGPLRLLIDKLKLCHPPREATSKKAFAKFEDSFLQQYSAQLEGMGEEAYRKYEKLDEIFKFLEDIIPDDSDEEDVKPNLRGQKRRSRSTATTATGGDDEGPRTRSKRPRYSTETDERRSTRDSVPPSSIVKEEPIDLTRLDSPPPRISSSKPGPPPPGAEVIEISSDSDEDSDPPPRQSSRPRPKPKPRYRPRPSAPARADTEEEREEDVDHELSRLLSARASLNASAVSAASASTSYTGSANVTKDSLFSTDSEEDEDEVNDIITGRR